MRETVYKCSFTEELQGPFCLTNTVHQVHTLYFINIDSNNNNACHTKSRLTLYIGVRVNKVFCLISCKDVGLNEAQQGVELLQVVLDGRPCQQDSEAN